jgi:hypothetical protein
MMMARSSGDHGSTQILSGSCMGACAHHRRSVRDDPGSVTRASLGNTGRPRHAGPMTAFIYMLVTLGAMLGSSGQH